uniref:Uncharacterized protein n=1 Tax=Rhizophagus irregularis (strain DAOM 181602 / DAOM 197198 / MUCL 43194) TaxID=747089 RepID=U9TLR0_RHIID
MINLSSRVSGALGFPEFKNSFTLALESLVLFASSTCIITINMFKIDKFLPIHKPVAMSEYILMTIRLIFDTIFHAQASRINSRSNFDIFKYTILEKMFLMFNASTSIM